MPDVDPVGDLPEEVKRPGRRARATAASRRRLRGRSAGTPLRARTAARRRSRGLERSSHARGESGVRAARPQRVSRNRRNRAARRRSGPVPWCSPGPTKPRRARSARSEPADLMPDAVPPAHWTWSDSLFATPPSPRDQLPKVRRVGVGGAEGAFHQRRQLARRRSAQPEPDCCGSARPERRDSTCRERRFAALNARHVGPIGRLRCPPMAAVTATGGRMRRSGARLPALAGGMAMRAAHRRSRPRSAGTT